MRYDVIVVGAGSAGAILATRLSEDPNRSVLLIEAGADYPDLEHLPKELKFGFGPTTDYTQNQHFWSFVARATDKAPLIRVPRGKVSGGSSAVNAQIFLRGLPEDYNTWAAAGNDQWGFQRILPYLRKVETDLDFDDHFHGSDGPIMVQRFKPEAWLPNQVAFYNACRLSGYSDCPE